MRETKPPTISVMKQYGLFYFWTLIAFGKRIYLGEDTKFCKQFLRKTDEEVCKAIGSDDMRLPETRQKLAKYIIDQLGLTQERADLLQENELMASQSEG